MVYYYPTYHQQGDANGVNVTDARNTLLLCIGLFSLLHLQYVHDGHMDEHVFDLFSLKMLKLEQVLSNSLEAYSLENVPF